LQNKDFIKWRRFATEAVSVDVKEEAEHYEFQAETRQLLDIVTHSLYTDKEVFLRELVSNASDACEKLRHMQASGEHVVLDPDVPLEIRIWTDENEQTLTVQDTGIGLSKEEMIMNLGTIARSGSKAFVQAMQNQSQPSALEQDVSRGIIGKFGVGFYSAFMVGDTVQVKSRPAIIDEKHSLSPHVWTSTGLGTYDIEPLHQDSSEDAGDQEAEIISQKEAEIISQTPGDQEAEIISQTPISKPHHQPRGSSVVIKLKENCSEFATESLIESILKKYSNFVNFPILLNGRRVNTMEAVWAKQPQEVTESEHTAFYKFIANAYDEPLSHIHFRADAPLEVKALFYIPSFHTEKHGMSRMDPGVSLYSRKILIEHKSPDILPEWLRFVKGVVDSEDIPLAISREKAQDSALIKKLRRVLTRKVINYLSSMAKKESDKYKTEFWHEYGFFIKEGICQDYEFQDQLSKLLYYETSKTPAGELSSLDEYVSRCTPEQKEIYYLCAPNRDLAITSPYLEGFRDKEVILVYGAIDDFVLTNLTKYQNRKFVNAESGNLDLSADNNSKDDPNGKEASKRKLSDAEAIEFCDWLKQTLPDKVEQVKVTNRLDSSPAVVTDHESGALRRMMRLVDTSSTILGSQELRKQTVEINPYHPVITGLNAVRHIQPDVARVCAEQIFDNCLIAAGLMDDSRTMLPRLNDLLLSLIKEVEPSQQDSDELDVKSKSKSNHESTPTESSAV